jgi:hypothetical protein
MISHFKLLHGLINGSWNYLASTAAVGGLQTNKEYRELHKKWLESMTSSSSKLKIEQHPLVYCESTSTKSLM